MTQTYVSTTSIILLVVGLAVGGGVGYFWTQSTYTPIINDYNLQITDTENQIDDLTTQISKTETEISSLTGNISLLETENSGIEAEIEELEEEIEELDPIFNECKTTRTELESKAVPRNGCFKFSAFGVSFDYPKDMELALTNVFGDPADASFSSVIVAKEDLCDFSISWISVPYYPEVLNVSMASMKEALDIYEANYSENMEIEICDYTGLYLTYNATLEGKTEYGIIATIYCSSQSKAYNISYGCYSKEDFKKYSDYLYTIILEA